MLLDAPLPGAKRPALEPVPETPQQPAQIRGTFAVGTRLDRAQVELDVGALQPRAATGLKH